MELFIIRRWDATHPKNEITNRLEYFDYNIVYNYSSNQTSDFSIAYPYTVRKEIFQGDFLYAPDFKYIGIIKSYDPNTGKLIVGDILNAYRYPHVFPSDVVFTNPAGALIDGLNKAKNDYPELKVDMINWSSDAMLQSRTTINFGSSQQGYEVVDFWEFASKLMMQSRGTDQTKGLRIIVDNVVTNGPNGVQINMRLTQTNSLKTQLAYHQKESEKDYNRFITSLDVNDKVLTQNSVILYNKNGDMLSQWYLDMNTGNVSNQKPNSSQYPIYIGGHIYDTEQKDAPSQYDVAVGQLPINQSDSFVFTVPTTQKYLNFDDVMTNTLITLSLVENDAVVRTLKGSVTTVKISQTDFEVSVGMDTPKLKLQI